MDSKNDKSAKPTKGYYGKRPLWQWVVLYVILGAIAYFLIYMLFFRHGSSSGSSLYNY